MVGAAGIEPANPSRVKVLHMRKTVKNQSTAVAVVGSKRQEVAGRSTQIHPSNFPLLPDALRDLADVLETDNPACDGVAEYLEAAHRGRPDLERLWVALALFVAKVG
jgi:hypothetical protein